MLLIAGALQTASAQNNQASGFYAEVSEQADSTGTGDAQWQEIRNENGIQVYSLAVQNTAIVKARALAIINAPLENIQQLVDKLPQRSQWVPYLSYSKIIEKISATEQIEYSLFSAPWPASNRDFVYRLQQSQQLIDDRLQLSYRMQSVNHAAMPSQPGLIRGEIFYSVYRLTAINAEQTQLELIYHADPRGWLPNWIVNIIQRGFPFRMMQNLKRQLEQTAGPNEGSGNPSSL